jgi:hypothetical protein
MNTAPPPPRGPKHSLEFPRTRSVSSSGESMRSSYGRLPKIQFPVFNGDDP